MTILFWNPVDPHRAVRILGPSSDKTLLDLYGVGSCGLRGIRDRGDRHSTPTYFPSTMPGSTLIPLPADFKS